MQRLTRLAQSRDGVQLATFAHGYDTVGNLTSRVFEHRSGDPSEDYQYDSLYRLTRTDFGQRSGTPYEGFVYDHLGNHLTQDHDGTTIAGIFNDVNEQTDRGTETLTWNLRGNLTEDDDGQQYAYDRSNLLTEVKDGTDAVIATYAYDALGRRIEKAIPGGATTRFYYDDQQLIEERDGSGSLQRQYVWGGQYIDELILFKDVAGEGGTADADYLVLRHHNFNIVALVDRSDGSVVERYDYTPYGQRQVYFSPGPNDPLAMAPTTISRRWDVGGVSQPYGLNSIGHQGLSHDEVTELVHNRARMLHPRLGRFMQKDPLGQNEAGGGYQDGMNLYQYVNSTPIGHLDPFGRKSIASKVWRRLVSRMLTAGVINWAFRANRYNWTDDEREFDRFEPDMENLYSNYLKAISRNNSEVWGIIDIDEHDVRSYTGQWIFPSTGVFSTGWWLNGAERVSVSGSLEICCKDGYLVSRNIDMNWTWHDSIDGNSAVEWWQKRKGVKSKLKGLPNFVIESLHWDLFWDKIADVDYGVDIGWSHRRQNERRIIPLVPCN